MIMWTKTIPLWCLEDVDKFHALHEACKHMSKLLNQKPFFVY